MADESDTGEPLNFKILLAQKKAERVKALQEANALQEAKALEEARALQKLKALQDAAVKTATVSDIQFSSATVPPTRDQKYITSDEEEDDENKPLSSRRKAEKAKTSFDSDNTFIPSSGNPIGLDSQSRSSTNPKLSKREPFQPDVSQSSIILKSIELDKRRFFRPLADAIATSSAINLVKYFYAYALKSRLLEQ